MTEEFGLARNTDPDTSHDAAHSFDAAELELIVWNTLYQWGPMTSEQVAEFLNINLVSISPRFRPLVNKGAIIDTGEKRRNRSGRSAILWKAIKDIRG